MSDWKRGLTTRQFLGKVWTRVLPNVASFRHSRIRRCRACGKVSLFVALHRDEEFHRCIRCHSNLRYEMLAEVVRQDFGDLATKSVLELDPGSPLSFLLRTAGRYTPSYFRPNDVPGSRRADGVVCEDITRLTLPDASLDLIVSSDVLEHVPDAAAAFRESARVLKVGGSHLFTVPPRAKTRQRARLRDGSVEHLVQPPEFHLDPLDAAGVLVFWDFGSDLPEVFATPGLVFDTAKGPEGLSRRAVWRATRVS